MGNHTPGPWELAGWREPLPRSFCAAAQRIQSGAVVVAEVATCETDFCPGLDSGGANARLIASAPELLDELKEAEKVIRWAAQRSEGRVRADVVNGWLHHAKKIGAAIAKAEGRGE